MIFLFPRWDMLVPWRVIAQQQEHQRKIHSKVARHWHWSDSPRFFPSSLTLASKYGTMIPPSSQACQRHADHRAGHKLCPLFWGVGKGCWPTKDGYLTCLECFCVDLLQVLDMIFLAVFAKWFHLTHWWRCKSSPRPQSLWELCYTASTGVAWPFANGWPHKTILLKCCEESYRTPSVWCMFKRENQCLQ